MVTWKFCYSDIYTKIKIFPSPKSGAFWLVKFANDLQINYSNISIARLKRSTSEIKGPRNVPTMGSSDSAGSKIISEKLWNSRGEPAVWGLKFSMVQKNYNKCHLGECQMEEVPPSESSNWRTGSKNLTLGRTGFLQVCRRS